MKINVVEADSFKPKYSQGFFLDSNVWMYLYFPQYSAIPEKVIKSYSQLLSNILRRNGLIQTNLIQMSELINLIIQLEYRVCKKKVPSLKFKDFRASSDGVKALLNAKTLTSNILKNATLTSGIFNSDEMKAMVDECDRADFNDLFFASFCQKQGLTLVTHDYDFNAVRTLIPVVSANGSYLNE